MKAVFHKMPGSALLSRGVIASHLHQGLLPPDDRAVFRILALRHLGGDSEPAKYRLAVVDVDKGQESRPENKVRFVRCQVRNLLSEL